MSRVDESDAREWLESLQQVGEGWYRQVALAISVGAHKALGMERREFAQAIGQRMIDPRQAIIELHREGQSETAIAEILGVSRHMTVHRILSEEGLVEPHKELPPVETGAKSPESASENGAISPPASIDDSDERIAALPVDLAERVQGNGMPLAEAETVVDERAAHVSAYIQRVRHALDLLMPMAGHPIPRDLSAALSKEELKALRAFLKATKEVLNV